MKNRIVLTYNPREIQDGYFAQFQRQIAIMAIAKKFKCSYLHTPILDIDGIMFDLLKNQSPKKVYIQEMNKKYDPKIKDKSLTKFDVIVNISCPTIFDLLKLIIKFQIHRKKALIEISNPHGIMEKINQNYLHIINENYPDLIYKDLDKNQIIVHIRKGVSNEHVLPTEAKSRTLSEEYYLNIIKKIVKNSHKPNELTLEIFTDSPEFDMYFAPDVDENWSEFDYLKKNGKILVEGHKFSLIKDFFPGKVLIHRNGNPDNLILAVSKSKYFIMSRSSMSFVAALFHPSGVNFYPPNFWHKPLSNWTKTLK